MTTLLDKAGPVTVTTLLDDAEATENVALKCQTGAGQVLSAVLYMRPYRSNEWIEDPAKESAQLCRETIKNLNDLKMCQKLLGGNWPDAMKKACDKKYEILMSKQAIKQGFRQTMLQECSVALAACESDLDKLLNPVNYSSEDDAKFLRRYLKNTQRWLKQRCDDLIENKTWSSMPFHEHTTIFDNLMLTRQLLKETIFKRGVANADVEDQEQIQLIFYEKALRVFRQRGYGHADRVNKKLILPILLETRPGNAALSEKTNQKMIALIYAKTESLIRGNLDKYKGFVDTILQTIMGIERYSSVDDESLTKSAWPIEAWGHIMYYKVQHPKAEIQSPASIAYSDSRLESEYAIASMSTMIVSELLEMFRAETDDALINKLNSVYDMFLVELNRIMAFYANKFSRGLSRIGLIPFEGETTELDDAYRMATKDFLAMKNEINDAKEADPGENIIGPVSDGSNIMCQHVHRLQKELDVFRAFETDLSGIITPGDVLKKLDLDEETLDAFNQLIPGEPNVDIAEPSAQMDKRIGSPPFFPKYNLNELRKKTASA